MPIEVTYTNLEYPFGKKFATKGLGVFENGVPKILTKEEEDLYKQTYGKTVVQGLKDDGNFDLRHVNNPPRKVGGE